VQDRPAHLLDLSPIDCRSKQCAKVCENQNILAPESEIFRLLGRRWWIAFAFVISESHLPRRA